jgi:hypothetical protein
LPGMDPSLSAVDVLVAGNRGSNRARRHRAAASSADSRPDSARNARNRASSFSRRTSVPHEAAVPRRTLRLGTPKARSRA